MKIKNTLFARHSAPSVLFLTTAFLLILSPLTGNAQSSSTLVSLEGTSWQGTISEIPGVTTEYKYVFTEKGNVKESFRRQASGIDQHYEWNPITRDQDLKLKPFEKHYDGHRDCTYKQDGNSVQFKCGELLWNATIQGNRMEGKMTFFQGTAQQSTVVWSIERMFPVPADSPLLGTWKCVEHSSGTVSRTIIVTYSQNGLLEVTFQDSLALNEKRNWNYTSESATSGVEEDYRIGGELIERDDIRWINSNQFESKIVFHLNPNSVGKKQIFTRQ